MFLNDHKRKHLPGHAERHLTRALVYNRPFAAISHLRMFTPDQVQTIATQLARKQDRTQLVDLDGTPVIVKRLEAPLKHWGYPVLNLSLIHI